MAVSPPRRFAVVRRRAPAASRRLCGQRARPAHHSLPVPFSRRSWPLPVVDPDPNLPSQSKTKGRPGMDQSKRRGALAAFGVVTTLFCAWGFITSLNDPVVTAVKGIFCLTDFRAQLSAFAFFIAYGVMSFPAAVLLSRLKSIPTILIAFAMMIAGCLLMLLA